MQDIICLFSDVMILILIVAISNDKNFLKSVKFLIRMIFISIFYNLYNGQIYQW